MCNCIWPSKQFVNLQTHNLIYTFQYIIQAAHKILYEDLQIKLKLMPFLATVPTNKMVILTIVFLQCMYRLQVCVCVYS